VYEDLTAGGSAAIAPRTGIARLSVKLLLRMFAPREIVTSKPDDSARLAAI
jgi:hypothetical protein